MEEFKATGEVNWTATLGNIVYQSTLPAIEFSMKDIENMHADMVKKDAIVSEVDALKAELAKTKKAMGELSLMLALQPTSVTRFKVYA